MDPVHQLQIEQPGRCAGHGTFGFNGTGGIWRKEAVRAAGGWCSDSVTEDVDLGYKATAQGYRLVYVRDMPQSLEIPASTMALIQQKNRWTKGHFQVFRLSMIDFLRSPRLGSMAKVEMFLHLTENIQSTLLLLSLLASTQQVMNALNHPFMEFWAVCNILLCLILVATACYSKVPGRGELKYDTLWGRTKRLLFGFSFFAMNSGMSLFRSVAIMEGLFSSDITFLATPKKGSKNAVKRKALDDFVAWTGITVGIYRLSFFLEPIPLHRSRLIVAAYLLFNATTTIGLFWVNGTFLLEKYDQSMKKHSKD